MGMEKYPSLQFAPQGGGGGIACILHSFYVIRKIQKTKQPKVPLKCIVMKWKHCHFCGKHKKLDHALHLLSVVVQLFDLFSEFVLFTFLTIIGRSIEGGGGGGCCKIYITSWTKVWVHQSSLSVCVIFLWKRDYSQIRWRVTMFN